MKNVYVVRKYVIADSIKSALLKEKKTKVHDCWLEENSQREMLEKLKAPTKNIGLKTCKKN